MPYMDPMGMLAMDFVFTFFWKRTLNTGFLDLLFVDINLSHSLPKTT